jgi:hypothetical protein
MKQGRRKSPTKLESQNAICAHRAIGDGRDIRMGERWKSRLPQAFQHDRQTCVRDDERPNA